MSNGGGSFERKKKNIGGRGIKSVIDSINYRFKLGKDINVVKVEFFMMESSDK